MGPLNISVKGEYALQAILDLTMQKSVKPVKIASIAKRQRIPQKFLELILAGLKHEGFVESRRGADGGYLLARSPEDITVGEVIRFIEGTRINKVREKRKMETPFSDMWRRIDKSVSEVLDGTTFAELSRVWKEKQATFIPNWDI